MSLFFCPVLGSAQTYLRIHQKGGLHSDVPIEQIDSISFVNGTETPQQETGLAGSWLWGDANLGYFELLTFNNDKTYSGYDNYFTYGFDTMTYGWYMLNGALLTLQSNGFGYNHWYRWFVMGLTDNALDVMTKTGRFTYYRLQPETIRLQLLGTPLECDEGESFVFADGVIASIVGGKLQGVKTGTTYIQKHLALSNTTLSYKVVVE